MKVGYARVSTLDQNLELQTDALLNIGCEKIFTDRASGAKDDRQGLIEAIEFCRKGDSLVVWKLDRLGRSLKHLIETINELHERQVGFASVQENIDTTTPGGKLIFHVFGALAEFERELITERTNAGLASARARGRLGGRPKAMTQRQIQMAKTMLADPHTTVKEVCETLDVSKSTLYRYLKPVAEKQIK
jgi:DNA invertase Pin-like site-specific DNA recombinase